MSSTLDTISLKTNDGHASSLGAYAGTVRLVVNVASKCGLTPQYEGLEALYRKYRDLGLVILAFPANEFGAQEPGTDAEIKDFCASTYDVSFPLFAKIVVKGEGKHPLYTKLTHDRPAAWTAPGSDFREKLIGYGIHVGAPPEILWNFEKFVIGRDGAIVERFAPDVAPDAPILIETIERALAT